MPPPPSPILPPPRSPTQRTATRPPPAPPAAMTFPPGREVRGAATSAARPPAAAPGSTTGGPPTKRRRRRGTRHGVDGGVLATAVAATAAAVLIAITRAGKSAAVPAPPAASAAAAAVAVPSARAVGGASGVAGVADAPLWPPPAAACINTDDLCTCAPRPSVDGGGGDAPTCLVMRSLAWAAGGGGAPHVGVGGGGGGGVALYCARSACPPVHACDCNGVSVCAKEAPAADGSTAVLACIGSIDDGKGQVGGCRSCRCTDAAVNGLGGGGATVVRGAGRARGAATAVRHWRRNVSLGGRRVPGRGGVHNWPPIFSFLVPRGGCQGPPARRAAAALPPLLHTLPDAQRSARRSAGEAEPPAIPACAASARGTPGKWATPPLAFSDGAAVATVQRGSGPHPSDSNVGYSSAGASPRRCAPCGRR